MVRRADQRDRRPAARVDVAEHRLVTGYVRPLAPRILRLPPGMTSARIGLSEPPLPAYARVRRAEGVTVVVVLTECDARLVSEVPWLSPDGDFRCFYCETKAAYPGRNLDPDKVNPDLRDAHRLLWSKAPLGGGVLGLSALRWSDYLKVVSSDDGWTLGSDQCAAMH